MIPRNKTVIELPRTGSSQARLFGFADWGTQKDTNSKFGSGERRQFRLYFELPMLKYTTGDKVGKPMIITHGFTATIGKKSNFRKFLETWFARKFATDEAADVWFDTNLWKLVGQSGMATVTHNEEETWANIAAMSPFEPGYTPAPRFYDPIFLLLDSLMWNPTAAEIEAMPSKVPEGLTGEAAHEMAIKVAKKEALKKFGTGKKNFDALPEWDRKKIMITPEYVELTTGVKQDRQTTGAEAAQPDAPEPTEDDVPF